MCVGCTQQPELKILIESAVKFIIDKFYWTSPYRWIDEWQKHAENKVKDDTVAWKKIRDRRYLLSESYILGWFGLAIVLLAVNQWLPTVLIFVLMLRVAGILNKELGVVLFGICHITEDTKVSPSARVILLALVNYLTAGLLFASLYAKIGIYQLDTSSAVSPLPISQAVVEGLSVLFTLSPAYSPLDLQTRLLTISESAFCFLFGILIISSFVNLVQLSLDRTVPATSAVSADASAQPPVQPAFKAPRMKNPWVAARSGKERKEGEEDLKQTYVFLLTCVAAIATIASTSVASLVANPVSPCDTSVKAPMVHFINTTSAVIEVFTTNSTATVCVEYSLQVPYDQTPLARRLVNGTFASTAYLTVSAHRLVSLVGLSSATIAFTMTPTSGTKGIFEVSLPSPCYAPSMILAVGYSRHQLNDTTLRIPVEQTSCPAVTGGGRIVGTFNLEVVWVKAVAVF